MHLAVPVARPRSIEGHPEVEAEAHDVLSKFAWGEQFLALNRAPLEAYRAAADSEAVVRAQAEFT